MLHRKLNTVDDPSALLRVSALAAWSMNYEPGHVGIGRVD